MRPLARGYIHQVAFYIALVACALLISQSHDKNALISNIIYSITLVGMFGISSFYHCPLWNRRQYLFIRNIDHAAIFALIAGTATPICLLGLKNQSGVKLLYIMWGFATIGMLMTIFWAHRPKWARSLLYVTMGWLCIPFFPEIKLALGIADMQLLLIGGLIYTLGALVYAFKRPNPFPKYFGYHEIFHLLIVIASIFHFIVIYKLTV